MAKKFGFFNSIGGDRKYLASDLSLAFDIGITTGLKAEEGNLQVVPYQGMQVQIQPGSAMIHGHFFVNDEPEIITLDVADAELNRIDRIVLRYDAYAREINTAVIKGTPAVNPNPPARLETPEQFDLVLADIYIPAAVTEINQSNITDMRDSPLCGYIGVKGAVSQLEFDRHLADYAKEATRFTIESDSIYERTNCAYYKKNGFVFLALGSIQKKDASAFEIGEYIATLPVGFRPKQTLYVQGMAQTGSIRNPISLIVYSSGEVQMGQTSSDTIIRLSVSYYAGGGTV